MERLQKSPSFSAIALFWALLGASIVIEILFGLFKVDVVMMSALTAGGVAALYFVAKDKQLYLSQTVKTLAVVAFVSMLAAGAPTFAQESTAVPLDIPTDVIFSETNSWLVTFAPIAAIGIGITVALAVLGYIGKMIVSAFKR